MTEVGKIAELKNEVLERQPQLQDYREIKPDGDITSHECKDFWDDMFCSEIPDDIKPDLQNNDLEVDGIDEQDKKGGSYAEVFKEGEGEKYEVHHMPADSVSKIERNDGPAIKMEKADHRQTSSCGSSKEAREYRSIQKELIDQGKFREALQMDIDDIHEKFGDKYDAAIGEMLDYANGLEKEQK